MSGALGGGRLEELLQDFVVGVEMLAELVELPEDAAKAFAPAGGRTEEVGAGRIDPNSLPQTDRKKRYLFGFGKIGSNCLTDRDLGLGKRCGELGGGIGARAGCDQRAGAL